MFRNEIHRELARTDAKRRETARNSAKRQCTSTNWRAHETKRNELRLFRFISFRFVSIRRCALGFTELVILVSLFICRKAATLQRLMPVTNWCLTAETVVARLFWPKP